MSQKPADIGSKRLIGLAPNTWVQWLLGAPAAQASDLLSSDFQWVSREGDALLRAQSPACGEFVDPINHEVGYGCITRVTLVL